MMSKRIGVVSCAFVVLMLAGAWVTGFCADEAAPAPAGSSIFPEVPLSAVVPAKKDNVIVKVSGTDEVVPSQVEREGDNLRVTWLERELEIGEPKGYRIEYTDDPVVRDPRGVYLTKGDDAVDVKVKGSLFTRYVFAGAPKPYCFPVIGPTGKSITRSYPMSEVEGESRDHPHHRSFWFTFGDVNGVDFWAESSSAGKIVHKSFEKLVGGSVYGRICALNDWIAPDGKKVCEDRREMVVYRTESGQLIDLKVTIRATGGPLKLGDTKEGMMAFRVAHSMAVDQGQGHIVNARGEQDGAAWGRQSAWCDYYGLVDGKTVGIAIMEHPSSFRYPTYWHVRTYGLFAANPFGVKDFTGDKSADGSHTIPAGGEVTFQYRIFIHEGSAEEAKVAEVYSAFANAPEVTLE